MTKTTKKRIVKKASSTIKVSFKKETIFTKIGKFFKNTFSKKAVQTFFKKPIFSSKWLPKLALVLLFVFSFALVDLLVQYLNNGYSMAIVNGTRIPRSEYLDRLEKAYGVTAATRLIEESLIQQGAREQGITASEQEVQDRINQYYDEQGGKDAVLATLKANNLTEEDLREQVRLSILLEKTLSKDITYTDKDLKAFFEEYKSYLYTEKNPKFEDKKAEIVEYYVSQKVQELRTGWVSELEAKSKIQNNITVKPAYGFLKTSVNMVTNLYNTIKDALTKK